MVAFDEIDHDSHPHHKLKLKREETPYNCDVCKELGFHSRYTCEEKSCSFHLHKGCAEASPTFQHGFFKRCNFFLIREGRKRRVCDACGLHVKGSIYHCYDCGKDLHPCCAYLDRRIEDGDVALILQKEMPSKCYICGEKKVDRLSTWGYVSTDKNYSLHIACVKKQMLEIWMRQQSFGNRKGDSTKGSKAVRVSDGSRALVKRTPMLQLAVGEAKAVAASGKFAKINKTVKIAITFIIAAILGDATAIVASFIYNLISH